MADEELYATKGYLDPIRSGHHNLKESDFETPTLSVGGNTAQIGDIVTMDGETWPAVDLCQAGENPYGVIVDLFDRQDITNFTVDTAITDGTKVKVVKIRRGIGIVVAMKLAPGAVAHIPGDRAVAAAAGEILKSVAGLSTSNTYTDAAVNAEIDRLEQGYIGKFADSLTGHATDAKVTLVEI